MGNILDLVIFLCERFENLVLYFIVASRWKPSSDPMRLGEYPSPLGEFIQNSQEILAVQFMLVWWRACAELEQIIWKPISHHSYHGCICM